MSVAAEWNLWNEAVKGLERLEKTAGQFKSERLTEMKLLRVAAD
ncbi:hypothetical protein OAG16_01570 [Saprospiraceae bacterium]|nr:hypothetical protein [Saprospiraceae bacterium]